MRTCECNQRKMLEAVTRSASRVQAPSLLALFRRITILFVMKCVCFPKLPSVFYITLNRVC